MCAFLSIVTSNCADPLIKYWDGVIFVVELTNGEFSLLTAFLSAPQRILTRDQLLDLSRLHNAEVYDRSIDVQILRLRRKIEPDPANPTYIKTERGAGYLFDADVQAMR